MENTNALDLTGELDDASKRQILQDAGLFISDPSSYPNLALTMNSDVGLDHGFRPVAYDTTLTTREKVRCSICEQRQFHNHGFIVRVATGEVGLVGRDCGERFFFGDDGWKRVEANARIASDRAIFERRWGPAKAAMESIIPLAGAWAQRLNAVTTLQSAFAKELPELDRALVARMRGGQLSTERRIEVPYETPDGERRVRIDYVPTVVCDVGADWFFHKVDLEQAIRKQIRALQNCIGQLNADMESKAVVALIGRLRDIRKHMQDVAAQQAQLTQLLNSATWDKLTKWARVENVPPANYRFKKGKLKCSDEHYHYYDYVDPKVPHGLAECWQQVSERWPRL